MKNKVLLFLAIVFTLNACKKNEVDPHVFERGQIISSEVAGTNTAEDIRTMFTIFDPYIAIQINYQYDVNSYTITYETITPDGEETQASGLLTIPSDLTTAAPLLSYQHGTILKQDAVPTGADQMLALLGMAFGTEGYIVCMPDFLGLGEGEGLHPYMHAKSEATATIDMIRAAKNKLDELGIEYNDQLFLMGYSQGGHATMATHKAIEEEYADEFTVTASSPMAGPHDVSGIMAEIVLRKQEYIAPAFLPYMLYAYNSVYNLYDDLESIFVAPYDTYLPPFFDGENLYTLNEVGVELPPIPSDILTESAYNDIMNNTNPAFLDALEDNDLYDWHSTAPIRMFHCNGDVTVPKANSDKALASFLDKGITNVELINPLEGGTHYTCAIPSIFAAKEWFNTF
ncbi:MAG: lipase family protein [Bacteroidota bacterium]